MSLSLLHSINPRRQGSIIYKVLKGKSMLCRISYPVKLTQTQDWNILKYVGTQSMESMSPSTNQIIYEWQLWLKNYTKCQETMNKDLQSSEGRKHDLKILSLAKVSFYILIYSFAFTSSAFILHLEYKGNKHSEACKNLKMWRLNIF